MQAIIGGAPNAGQTLVEALLHSDCDPELSTDFLVAAAASKPHTASILCRKRDGTPFWGLMMLLPLSEPSATLSIGSSQAATVLLLVDVTANPQWIGSCLVGKQIGKGAFGTVYLGKEASTGNAANFL